MWKKLLSVLLLFAFAFGAKADNDWPYYKAYVLSSISSNGSSNSNCIYTLIQVASTSTGYVQQVNGHVWNISFTTGGSSPTNSSDGSNAWIWVQTNSNGVKYLLSRTNAWNGAVNSALFSSNAIVANSNNWNRWLSESNYYGLTNTLLVLTNYFDFRYSNGMYCLYVSTNGGGGSTPFNTNTLVAWIVGNFYPSNNPNNYVDQTVTNGVASWVQSWFYPSNNPNGFITIANVSQASNDAAYSTNWIVTNQLFSLTNSVTNWSYYPAIYTVNIGSNDMLNVTRITSSNQWGAGPRIDVQSGQLLNPGISYSLDWRQHILQTPAFSLPWTYPAFTGTNVAYEILTWAGMTNWVKTQSYTGTNTITAWADGKFYPSNNPNNYVDSSVTNGVASWVQSWFYPSNNPNGFISTSGTNGLASILYVDNATNTLQGYIDILTGGTNALQVEITNIRNNTNTYQLAYNIAVGTSNNWTSISNSVITNIFITESSSASSYAITGRWLYVNIRTNSGGITTNDLTNWALSMFYPSNNPNGFITIANVSQASNDAAYSTNWISTNQYPVRIGVLESLLAARSNAWDQAVKDGSNWILQAANVAYKAGTNVFTGPSNMFNGAIWSSSSFTRTNFGMIYPGFPAQTTFYLDSDALGLVMGTGARLSVDKIVSSIIDADILTNQFGNAINLKGSLTVTNTITVTDLVVKAGITLGGVRKTVWPSSSGVTNLVSTGTGTSLVYGVAGTTASNKSLLVTGSGTLSDNGAGTLTLNVTGGSSGGGSVSNLFWVDKNGVNQSAPSLASWTLLIFTNKVRDTLGNFSTNNSSYTVKTTGSYQFLLQVGNPESSSGGRRDISLYVNGINKLQSSTIASYYEVTVSAIPTTANYMPVYLYSNDVVQFYFKDNKTAFTVDGSTNLTFFAGSFLGN